MIARLRREYRMTGEEIALPLRLPRSISPRSAWAGWRRSSRASRRARPPGCQEARLLPANSRRTSTYARREASVVRDVDELPASSLALAAPTAVMDGRYEKRQSVTGFLVRATLVQAPEHPGRARDDRQRLRLAPLASHQSPWLGAQA